MSDTPISRRRALGAGLLLTAGGLGAWRLLTTDGDEAPPRAPLPVETEPWETFAPEYEAVRAQLQAALPFLILPRATVDAFLAALSQAKRKPRKPEQNTRLFLLSTDFFAHGADESRPLGYSQLYDPYRNPCYNPMEPA